MPAGSEFKRIRGAGGDGGVECLWIKPDGTKTGWQAKFIFDFDNALTSLSDSLATALKVHPTLAEFIVCLPYDLTGERNGRGRSQLQKFSGWKQAEVDKALALGRTISIDLRTSSTLLDRLTSIDPSNGKIRFWFDQTLLGPEWFANHLSDVRAAARPRYTPELRIDTPISLAFEALCNTPVWTDGVLSRLKKVKQALRDWERCLEETSTTWGAPFPDSLKEQGQGAKAELELLLSSFEMIWRGVAFASEVSLDRRIRTTGQSFESITEALRIELDSKHGEGTADNASWKQFMAEYQATCPAQHYDKGREIVEVCSELQEWIDSEVVRVHGRGGMLLTGQAGVGKTHAICDAADRRLREGLFTLVFLAEALPGSGEVGDNLRARMGLSADIGRDELLAILDSAGEMSGGPLLVAIDGLNETRPRSYWFNQLSAWVTQVRRYPFLKLCVSCRTTYIDHVIPGALDVAIVDHKGFAGMEFEAFREFCDHYGLEHPASPFLAEEFSNGLFLRLVCQSARDEGLTRIPAGSYGTRSAMKTFLNSKDKRYSQSTGSDERRHYPSKAVLALADELARRESRSISFDDAHTLIEGACSGAPSGLLEWLIDEGLLRVDAVVVSGEHEEHIFLPFERLGDHLIAGRLLEGETSESIHGAFESGGKLEFLVDWSHWQEFAGLREAVALEIPEVFGIELPELARNKIMKQRFDTISLRALTWRDPNSFSVRTSELLERTFTERGLQQQTLDQQLLVALADSAIDAFWLSRLLMRETLVDRDWYWCKFLHLGYEEKRSVKRLIDAAFTVAPELLPHGTVERWCIVLGWFFAAADRRVRDSATKAMVRFLSSHPEVVARTISHFSECNDDFVLERVLCASYGALLRNRSQDCLAEVGQLILDIIYAKSEEYQNALIRDHARSIVELAIQVGALDSKHRLTIESPQKSDWPLVIPSKERVEELKATIRDLPSLAHSCFMDDFFVYTLGNLRSFQDEIPKEDMAKWIFNHVFEMGYNFEKTYEYDGVMTYTYGSGRGRPKWAERIGKKYQWIALTRLAARLTDHLTPKLESWDEESLVVPLRYERGRDTDPSIISPNSFREKVDSWWSPYVYQFGNFVEMADSDWVEMEEDVPELSQFVRARSDDGREWIQLTHFPEWTSRDSSDDVSLVQNVRILWLQVRSYLLPVEQLSETLTWADGANWFGRWMPEGRDYYEGYVGEYPWGIPFQLAGYERDEVLRPDTGTPCPATIVPTTNDVSEEHEYDCYQKETVRLCVPAKEFFDGGMTWTPESAYSVGDRTVCFDPTMGTPGPSALLMDLEFISQWLKKHDLALLFTVLGEKLTTKNNAAARMVISCAGSFDGSGWVWTKTSKFSH